MKVVIQRVSAASVKVQGKEVSSIEKGFLILVGITQTDGEKEINYLSRKINSLRIFEDEEGVMNCSLADVKGEALVVSQFTLMASTRKGNRPSYLDAAKGEISEPLYNQFCKALSQEMGREVKRGIFGADMQVSLVNEGPATIIIDTKENLA